MSDTSAVTPDTLTIDAVGPMPVVRPATAAEVGEIVRRCAADGTAVYPVGGGTMLDYGLPPARPGVAVELRALDKVIDFPASDMTITVEAGITIARLNEITRAEGLHLPIDVPDPERATLGGAIACNVSGLRRYGYGTFRDYVLGITTVNDRGETVSAGGRVVKNVAGYDLMKLHTGALGTLGVITQVTLKLRPVPEAWSSCLFRCGPDQLGQALDLMNQSATRPVTIGFRRAPLKGESGQSRWMVPAIFEGNAVAVEWQEKRLLSEFESHGFPRAGGAKGDGSFLAQFTIPTSRFIVRASLRPSASVTFCERAAQTDGLDVLGMAAGAVVWSDLDQHDMTQFEGAKLLSRLLEANAASEDNLIVVRCPPEWKKSLPVWGRPPADLALQKAVKRALDPHSIFNPGRFVTDAF